MYNGAQHSKLFTSRSFGSLLVSSFITATRVHPYSISGISSSSWLSSTRYITSSLSLRVSSTMAYPDFSLSSPSSLPSVPSICGGMFFSSISILCRASFKFFFSVWCVQIPKQGPFIISKGVCKEEINNPSTWSDN